VSEDQQTATEKKPRRAAAAMVPGLALALAVAAVATAIGKAFPIVGGPVSGIVLGVLVAAVRRPGERLRPGLGFAGKRVLQISVVVLGTQLSLTQIVRVGAGL
jgi:uncharacterized membrane protein YadS